MKPIDFRNANFERLVDELPELRARAYAAWRAHGPGTTRAVAARSGMDLLTFRPRTTELCQLGLVRIFENDDEKEGTHEGVYEATPPEEWEEWREGQIDTQLKMQLT